MKQPKSTSSSNKAQTRPSPPQAIKEKRALLGKTLAALLAGAIVLSGAVATLELLAHVTVNTLQSVQASKAFSASFTVVNNGIVTLNHVNLLVGVCRVDMNLAGAFDPRRPRAVTIRGDGARFTPGSPGCTGPNGARFYNQNWMNHKLLPEEKLSVALDPVLEWLVPPQARDSVTVTSAIITIVVQFQPWIVPWQRELEFRFATQKAPGGTLSWFARSLDQRVGN